MQSQQSQKPTALHELSEFPLADQAEILAMAKRAQNLAALNADKNPPPKTNRFDEEIVSIAVQLEPLLADISTYEKFSKTADSTAREKLIDAISKLEADGRIIINGSFMPVKKQPKHIYKYWNQLQ